MDLRTPTGICVHVCAQRACEPEGRSSCDEGSDPSQDWVCNGRILGVDIDCATDADAADDDDDDDDGDLVV